MALDFHFDADAYLATLEAPTIIVGGVQHTGRHLSAAQWLRAIALYDRAAAAGSLLAFADVGRHVYDAMFPPPPRPAWYRRRPPSVWDQLLAGPPAVWQRGLGLFFASSILAPRTTTPAPGNSSDLSESSATSSPPTAGEPGTPPADGPPETA